MSLSRSQQAARAVLVLGLIATAVLVASAMASGGESDRGSTSTANACRNSLNFNLSQIDVTTSGSATPKPAVPSGPVTVSELSQTAAVPGSIFLTGYRVFLLQTGENQIPADVVTQLAATNTTEGVQTSSTEQVTITSVITDPTPGNRNSGDETATDGSFTANYDNATFTAVADPVPAGSAVEVRQNTQYPLDPSPKGEEKGSLVIRAVINNTIPIQFACSPGTVAAGTNPDGGEGTAVPIDTAPFFASTDPGAVEPTPSPSPEPTYVIPTPSPTASPSPTPTVTPPVKRCKVPKVKGKKLKAAKRKIRRANCKVGKVTKKKSNKVKKGRVIKTKPKAGARRARNFKVKVVVAR